MTRLLRMKPELESMVDDYEVPPLTVAAEQYATVNKYAGAFLQVFKFRSVSRHDPLLAAIALLKPPCREAADTPGSCPRSPTSAKLIGGSSSNKIWRVATFTIETCGSSRKWSPPSCARYLEPEGSLQALEDLKERVTPASPYGQ